MKKRSILAAAIALVMTMATGAQACTGIYVGPEASADGTAIIARSNDHQSNWANYIEITEAVEDQPGRALPVDPAGTVFAPIPEATYRYACTPWMDSTRAENGLQRDASVCFNECGVCMSMAVTAFANKAALTADPLVSEGVTEATASELVICQSATAREAVGKLLGILDSYGSSECNIAFIADQHECWYVEMYTGHQYAAVRLPADRVAVFGNEFNLRFAEDYEEYIVSEGLARMAQENGFAVFDDAGRLDLMDTYSGMSVRADYCHMRTWIGHKELAPTAYGDYAREGEYPLTFTAERRLSLADVMKLIRNRYEGTPYDPDATGRTDMRVIGTDTAMSVHVVEIDPALPAERSCTAWISDAPAVYGVFVPVNNACRSVSAAYGANQPAEELGRFDTAYPWFVMKGLNTLCMTNIPGCGDPVRAYWEKAEGRMIEGLHALLSEGTDEAVDAYCSAAQTQAYEDGCKMLNDVMWYLSANANTMKNGRDPETGETLSTLKPVDPMIVALDSDAYPAK